MALDFFRGVAGDLAARGSRLLRGDGDAYDAAKAEADEEERRRKASEEARRLFEEQLQTQRDDEERRRLQTEQARSWFDQAMQSARQAKDEAGEALGDAGQNLQAAASTVGQASSDLGAAVRERVDQAGQAKDAVTGAVADVAGDMAGAAGDYGRWRQDVQQRDRGPRPWETVVQDDPMAQAIAQAAPGQAQREEETALRERASEAEQRRRAKTIEEQGVLPGMLSNLVTGGLAGGDTPENREYQRYVEQHGGAGEQAKRMLGSAAAGFLGVERPGETGATGQYQPGEAEGLQRAVKEAGEQAQTVFNPIHGEGPWQRAQAGLGLAMSPYNVLQEGATGAVGRATGDPVSAQVAGLGAALMGPGGVESFGRMLPTARGALRGGRLGRALSEAEQVGAVGATEEALAGAAPGVLRRITGAARGAAQEAGAGEALGAVGTAASTGVSPVAGVKAYQDAKARGESDEQAWADAIEAGGNVAQMGELLGLTPAAVGLARGTGNLAVGGARRTSAIARALADTEPARTAAREARRLAEEETGTGGPGARSRGDLQRQMAEAVRAAREAGVDQRAGPGADATPAQRDAWARLTDARRAMADFTEGRRAQQAPAVPERVLVERRAAEAGRGREGIERRAAEEAAAPGPVTRTNTQGQPIRLFSQLERALDDPRVQQAANAGDPQMVLRRLREAGVTDQELRWTGTADLAQRTDPITLDELRRHVASNRAEVHEIALGTPPQAVQALRDAQNRAADARTEAGQVAQRTEREMIRRLVDEGLYAPMPTDAPLVEQGGLGDLQATRRQLANEQRLWLAMMQDAARAHMRAGDDVLDAQAGHGTAGTDANGRPVPIDPQTLRYHHEVALQRRSYDEYAMRRGQRQALWQDDPEAYQRLVDLSTEFARQRRDDHAQTTQAVNDAQEAERQAWQALWPDDPINWGSYSGAQKPGAPRWPAWSSVRGGMGELGLGEEAGYREFLVVIPPGSRVGQGMGEPYTHAHWQGIQNPVLHVRTTVRSLPDGRRVLYVEEIQSDLHQASREAQRDPRTGRERYDAQGRKIPVGYRPWGMGIASESDPRVQARAPLWEARDRAWEQFRQAQNALRDWRSRPAPGLYDRHGNPLSYAQYLDRHPGLVHWKGEFTTRAADEARRQASALLAQARNRRAEIYAIANNARRTGVDLTDAELEESGDLARTIRQLEQGVHERFEHTPEDDAVALEGMRQMASQADAFNAREGRDPALEMEQLVAGANEGVHAGTDYRQRYTPGSESLRRFWELQARQQEITRLQSEARDALSQAQEALQRGADGGRRTPDDVAADVFIQERKVAQTNADATAAARAYQQALDDWDASHPDPTAPGAQYSREAQADPEIRRLRAERDDALHRNSSEEQLLDDMRRQLPNRNAPPETLFEETWPTVALRRMLVVAADEGLDGLAVISGENAARHVDAAMEIRELHYEPDRQDLIVVDANGQNHHIDVEDERQLREQVGDDLAQQLLARVDADSARVDADRAQADDEAYDRAQEIFFQRNPDATDEDWEDYQNNYGPFEGDYDYVDPARGSLGPDEIAQGQWAGNRGLVEWYNTTVRNAAVKLANRMGVEAEVSEVVTPESVHARDSRDLQGNPTKVETDVLVIPLDEARRQRLREEGLPLFFRRRDQRPGEAPARASEAEAGAPPAGVVGRDGAVALSGRRRPPDLTDLAGAVTGAGLGQEEERKRIEAERALGQDVGLGEEVLRRGGMGLLGAAGGVGIVRGGLRRGGPAGLIDLQGVPRPPRGQGSAAAGRIEPLGRPGASEMALADRERQGLTGPERRPTDVFGRPYPPGETLASQGGRPQENTVLRQVDDAFRAAAERARAQGRPLDPADVDLSGVTVPPGSHPTPVADLVAQARAGQADRFWYERMGEILDDATGPGADPIVRDELGATFANWGQQSLPLDNTRMALVSGLARAHIQANHPEVWQWLMTQHVITEGEVGRDGPGLKDPAVNPRAWLYEYLFNRAGDVVDPTDPTGPRIPVAQASWAQPYGIQGIMGPGQILGRQLALWRHGEANIPGGPKLSIYQGETADAPAARSTSLSTPDRHEFARHGLVGNDLAGEGGASQYVLAMNEALARHFFPGWAAKHVQAAGWSEYRRGLPRMTPADLQAGDPAHIRTSLAQLITDYRQAVQSGLLSPLVPHEPASLEGVVSRADPFATRPPKGPRARLPDPYTGMRVDVPVDAPTRVASQASTASVSPQIHLQGLTTAQADALVPPGGSGQVEPLRRASIPHATERTGDFIRVALTNADDAAIDDALARLHQAGHLPASPVVVVRPNLDPQAPITGVRLEHPDGKTWTRADLARIAGPEGQQALVVDGGRTLIWPDADDALADKLQENLKSAGYSDDHLTGFADAVEQRAPGTPGVLPRPAAGAAAGPPAGAAGAAPGAPGAGPDAAAGGDAGVRPARGRAGRRGGAPGAPAPAPGAPGAAGPAGDVSASARLVEPGPGASPLSPGERPAGRRRPAGPGAGEPGGVGPGGERPAGQPGAPDRGADGLGPPGPERPIATLAKVGQGKAGMGINKERLRDVLGGNMYSGDLAKVAVKEMLQNAVDSVRPKQGGKIAVDVDASARTIRITDQGLGMSRATLEGPFLDIAGSEKPEGASGGFGLAKIAYLSKAENMHVETVWQNPETGRFYHSTLDGSGDDWVNQNLDISSRAVSRSEAQALATQHGWEGSLTGADVRIHFTPEAKFSGWEATDFLKNWAQNTLLPWDFTFTSRGQPLEGAYDVDKGAYRSLFRTQAERPPLVTSIPFQGGTFDVYLSAETDRSSYPAIQVLNNGQPQFIHRMWLNDEQPMPKEIIVDVRSQHGPTEPNYPFQTNRESFRDEAKQALEAYIKDTLGQDLIRAENAQYKQAVQTAPKVAGSSYTVVNTSGYPQDIVDKIVAGAFNPNVGSLTRGKDVADLTAAEKREATRGTRAALKVLTDGFKAVQKALHEAYPRGNYDNAEFTGWGLGKSYYAVNVTTDSFLGPGSPRHVLINPYNLIRDTARDLEAELHAQGLDRWSLPWRADDKGSWDYRLAQRLASHMAADIIHELTHNEHGPHDAQYASIQTRNTGQAYELLLPVQKKLRAVLLENGSELLRQLEDEQQALESGGAGRLEDLFAKVGSQRPGAGGRPAGRSAGVPGGRGRGAEAGAGRGPGDGGPGAPAVRPAGATGAPDRGPEPGLGRGGPLPALPGQAPGGLEPGPGLGGSRPGRERPLADLRGTAGGLGGDGPAGGLTLRSGGAGAGAGAPGGAGAAGAGAGGPGGTAGAPGGAAPGGRGGQSRAQAVYQSFVSWAKLAQLFSVRGLLRQALGNVAGLPWQVAERTLAAGLAVPERLVRGATGAAAADLPTFREAGALAGSYLRPSTWRDAAKAAGAGPSPRLQQAMGAPQAPQGRIERANALGYHVLGVFDRFARSLAESAERNAQTARGGVSQADIDARASAAGDYRTLTQDLDTVGKAIDGLRDIRGGELVIPYWQIPYNGMKYDLERSPLGLAHTTAQTAKDLLTGQGRGGVSATEQYERFARGILGTGVAWWMWNLAMDDRISGPEPQSDVEKDAWQAQGKIPFALKWGSRWVPLSQLPGINAPLIQAAAVADFVKTQEAEGREMDMDAYQRLVNRAVTTTIHAVATKPFFDGIKNLLDVATENDESGERGLLGAGLEIASGFAVPGAVRDIERASSDVDRAPRDLGERVLGNIPGLSGLVPERRDVFGNVRRRTGSGLERYVNPMLGSEATPENWEPRYAGSATPREDTLVQRAKTASQRLEQAREARATPAPEDRPSAEQVRMARREEREPWVRHRRNERQRRLRERGEPKAGLPQVASRVADLVGGIGR